MDSLKKADIKGKRVRVTDDCGCKFIGSVEYVDYQRGKLGVTGTVEGTQGGIKSLQIFFRADIKKIVVFDDSPVVFAKIPAPDRAKTTEAQSTSPSYVLMPSGSEYRGGKYKMTSRMTQPTLGSAGDTSTTDTSKTDTTPPSPSSSTLESLDRTRQVQEYARVSDRFQPPPQFLPRAPYPGYTKPGQAPIPAANAQHTRSTIPASLPMSKDCAELPCYLLPSVVTVPNLPTGERDRAFNSAVKELLWTSTTTPPPFTTPSRLYYVEREGDLFEEAIVRLSACTRIGLSMEGQVLGRHGKTSLLVISSQEDVFVFDLLNMGVNAFRWGLYSVLSNKEVVKVVHDSRQVSDTLYHQYGLELVNVFDTLAGHVVFSNWVVKGEQRVAKPLYLAVRDYLGVPEEHLFTIRYSQTSLKEDTAVWLARPLPHHLIVGAGRNCMYLLTLATIMERAIEMPLEMAVKELMNSSVKSDDEMARQMVLAPQYLPAEVESSLPLWKSGSFSIRG